MGCRRAGGALWQLWHRAVAAPTTARANVARAQADPEALGSNAARALGVRTRAFNPTPRPAPHPGEALF
jgi:hypothetical protein